MIILGTGLHMSQTREERNHGSAVFTELNHTKESCLEAGADGDEVVAKCIIEDTTTNTKSLHFR